MLYAPSCGDSKCLCLATREECSTMRSRQQSCTGRNRPYLANRATICTPPLSKHQLPHHTRFHSLHINSESDL